ncbi:hypothetical protein COO60DRAFT_964595 [Scenedesmus sp. NREL 46B-D3]|nr:hypothetical protein COO60DRAFT_964595 [Scenedesmus sp. NREL 46B-D3]
MAAYPPPNANYPSYPLLGNRLVPFTAGSTTVTAVFDGGSVTSMSRAVTVTAKDTYLPTWPAAAAVSDTSVVVRANMSEAFTVSYQLLPSAQLDLAAAPPAATEIDTAGVTLLADAASGPFFLSSTAANLAPGTNYTLLTTVRQLSVLSPGVTALTGVLVPDTTAPSFTRSVVLSAARSTAQPDRFTVQMDLGLNEQGRVFYAVYGHPSCIAADPTPAEIVAGVNLADVNKCNCSSRFCNAAAAGVLPFSGAGASDKVSITGTDPTFVFDDLPAETFCSTYLRTVYAPTQQSLYLLAEDNLPTYKGWTSNCSMPIADPAPPGPCARVTVGRCINTPPAAEQVNQQLPPFAAVDLSQAAAAGPPLQPLKGVINVTDPVAAAFVHASINTTGASLLFKFQTTKPGLVQWRLVEQVTVEIANGYVAVRDASATQQVAVSRKCNGQQLVPGTAYAMWYNMTDVYGHTTDISILKVVM